MERGSSADHYVLWSYFTEVSNKRVSGFAMIRKALSRSIYYTLQRKKKCSAARLLYVFYMQCNVFVPKRKFKYSLQ